ncbi:unnamed protein product [Blepharisma stoltei]|uniref:PH domain-containing protein n=1 Tax=Blepharisma stoltei TaxID=1481888 RepID=A0AAU9IUE3_9CILI|nr:unnamed protein product [Blepharisma stoltei]
MEGFLKKWTNYVYGWRKRYFVLQNGVLKYCKKKGGTLKGTIVLNNSQIQSHTNPKRFIITTGVSSIHFKAENPIQANKWITALRNQQNASKSLSLGCLTPRSSEIPAPSGGSTIAMKVGELWGIHAQMQEAVDMIPKHEIRRIPGLDTVIILTQAVKRISAEILEALDVEEIRRSTISNTQKSPGLAPENHDTYSGFDNNLDDSEKIEEEYEKEIEFHDARSHASNLSINSEGEETLVIAPHRKCLPVLRNPNQKFNIWKVIKDSIGKEMSKITVPVYFNEPLSFLQRFCQDLTYSDTVDRASEEPDPLLRLALVACFAASGYAGTESRTMKPFNPLLGETFELEKNGLRVISEQVSHHPPASAIHCEHPAFTFWGNTEVKTSFKGTYLQVNPTGTFHLILRPYNDHFIWHKIKTNVHNIIMGKIYVENHGDLEMSNYSTGDRATLTFKKKGWFEKSTHEVTGFAYDTNGNAVYSIEGTWSKGLTIKHIETDRTIVGFEVYPNPPDFEQSYFFTDFALQLNLPPEYVPGLPPTDARLRPDQRALENGDLKLAAEEKVRVEEKQREARRKREEAGIEYKPSWFYYENNEWIYNGEYWNRRKAQQFEGLPDIF